MSVVDQLAKIRERTRERDYCLAVLELWARAKLQGIESDTVKGFGFSETHMPRDWKQKERLTRMFGSPHPYLDSRKRPVYFNYVRLNDGTVKVLDPPLTAVYKD